MDSKNMDEDEEMKDEEMAETESVQNVVNPATGTVDQIEKSRVFKGVLADHVKVTKYLGKNKKLVEKDDEFTEITRTADMGHLSLQLLPFYDLRPEDRVEFSDLTSATNSVIFGKYLLCQTVSFAREEGAAVVTIITDPKGHLAMPIALHNYSFGENSQVEVNADDILPPGSLLVLKNPSFKINGGLLTLISENPTEVELVSRKRLEAKFPDLEWEGEIAEKTLQFSQKRCFWNEIEGDEAAFDKLKGLGNKGLVAKRFSDALRFYNMALDYCTDTGEAQAIIQSNKSAALHALGCFNAALKCAEAALEVDPGYEKHNYRKAKALIGLGKYEEARNFLKEAFDQFPSLKESKDCKWLLYSDLIFLCARKNLGPTKSQLVSIYKHTLPDACNIPEFKGPLTVASEIEGKGRGLVATEDIRPGQLLLCAKAFAYNTTPPGYNLSTAYDSTLVQLWRDQIARKIANKLLFDPELRPEFYNLTAGAELGHLEPGDPAIGHVDMARIVEIVKINTLGEENSKESDEEIESIVSSLGLWIVPSLLNHSCSENNAEWHISGEVLTLTSIAEIKKGEELMIMYVRPNHDYKTRQEFCKEHGFSCNCKLCQLDAKEPISVRNEREEILKSLDQLTPKCCPGEIRKALEAVQRLVSLRKNIVSLNFPLLSAQVIRLAEILFLKGRYGDSISVLKRSFDVANVSGCWHFEGIMIAANLISSYALKGNRKMAKVWMATVKRLLIKFYGHLELVREFGETAVELLMNRFGIDFFQEDDD